MNTLAPAPASALSAEDFELALDELVSAEDFLGFLGVPFDQSVVHVNRLHIMQRYHDYLEREGDGADLAPAPRCAHLQALLARAYEDFVHSDALTEKVFKVFRQQEPATTFVSLDSIG